MAKAMGLVFSLFNVTSVQEVPFGIPLYVQCILYTSLLGTHLLCSKFYLLCYAVLLKNFAYYAQIMLTDIEQFTESYCSIPIQWLQFCAFIDKQLVSQQPDSSVRVTDCSIRVY